METMPDLPEQTLAKLQTIFHDLPQTARPSEATPPFISPFCELLDISGNKRELRPGEILFLQDNPGENLYWIESGVLAVIQGDLENPQLLTFRYPGHVVGEIALLENIPRTATVAAITPVKVKYLSNRKFDQILESIPVVGVELMRLLSARLREVRPAEFSAGLYDHLTGALSRQAFDVRLREEIDRADRYHYAFSLVFIDLDNFKYINDQHGHLRGDQALINFVQRIMADLRMTDLFFRYGGDEFILILQGIDQARGPALVRRLLDDLRSRPIPGNPPVLLSFSAGMSYYPGDGATPDALLQVADQRLYDAKREGRGRMVANQESGLYD